MMIRVNRTGLVYGAHARSTQSHNTTLPDARPGSRFHYRTTPR
jgi:hypothetical protein